MNIAIIGAGMSGLHAASLLNTMGHQISVFEANDYIGGHIQTLRTPFWHNGIQAQAIIDAGVFMFDPLLIHPYLAHLIQEPQASEKSKKNGDNPFIEIPLDFTIQINRSNKHYPCWKTNYVNKTTNKLKLFLDHLKQNIQSNSILSWKGYYQCLQDTRLMIDFLRFNFLLKKCGTDPQLKWLTMDAFFKKYHFSDNFIESWIFPQIHCWWGTKRDSFLNSSIQVFADSVFKVSQKPQYTLRQGVDHLVKVLSQSIEDKIHLNTPIAHIERNAHEVRINQQSFDAVLFAIPPCAVLKILNNSKTNNTNTVENTEKTLLSQFTTTSTTVYLHSDETWLPPKASWSTINLMRDERGSFCSFWAGRLHPLEPHLFLSWGDELKSQPEPNKTLHVSSFLRTLPTVDTVKASEAIHALQGENRTWYCGAHVHALGAQAHSLWGDNALKSGLHAAQAIDSWARSL